MPDPITDEWLQQYWTESPPGMPEWTEEDEEKRKKRLKYKKQMEGSGGLLGVSVQPEDQIEPDALLPDEPPKKLTEMTVEELKQVQDEVTLKFLRREIDRPEFEKISSDINDADFHARADPLEFEKRRYTTGLPEGATPDPEIMGFYGTRYTQGLKGEKVWQPVGEETLKEYRKKIDIALTQAEWDRRITKPKSPAEATETRDIIVELRADKTLTPEQAKKLDALLLKYIQDYREERTLESTKAHEEKELTKAQKRTRAEKVEGQKEYRESKARLKHVLIMEAMADGKTMAEAAKIADEKIKRTMIKPTTEWGYETRVPEGMSKLKEYGGELYIWDEEKGELREPTGQAEVFAETLKYQPIYSTKQRQIDAALRAYKRGKEKPGIPQADVGDIERMEMSTLYESDFARGLRVTFGLPSAVAATLGQKLMPGTQDTAGYKIAKGDTNQVLLNYALFQSVPDVTMANKYLVEVLGEDGAWWLGMPAEMLIPATGVGATLKAAGITGRALGTGIRKAGSKLGKEAETQLLLKFGSAINAISNPIETLKYNATAKRYDTALKLVNEGDIPAAVKATKRDTKWQKGEAKRILDKEWDRRELSNVAAEAMGNSLSELAVMKGIVESGKPSPRRFPEMFRYGSDNMEIKRRVDKQWNQFKDAAKTDPVLRRAFNEANHVRQMVKSLDEIKVSQETAPYLRRATLLNKEFNDELFKLQMGKLNWTDSQKTAFFKRIAKLEPEQRTGEVMARVLSELKLVDEGEGVISKIGSLEPWNASLTDIQKALGVSVGRTVKRGIMDYLPQDLAVIAGSVVAPLKSVKNKKNQQALAEDMTRLFGDDKIHRTITEGEEITYRLTEGQGDEIMAMLIDEVGVSRIRQSEYYYGLIKKLADPKSELTMDELFYLKENIIMPALAQKHFDAFKLTEASAQWERASVPIGPIRQGKLSPLLDFFAEGRRSSLIKVGSKGEPGYQPSSAMLTVSEAWKSLVYTMKKEGKLTEEIAVKSKSIEIDALWKELREVNRKVTEEFAAEIKAAAKETNPAQAYDDTLVNSWHMFVAAWRTNKERVVDENFGGSFYQYFLTKDKSVQEKILQKVGGDIARASAKGTIIAGLDMPTFTKTLQDFLGDVNKATDPLLSGPVHVPHILEYTGALDPNAQKILNEFIEDSFKFHTLDYDLYLEKADEWTKILQAYFNQEKILIADWKKAKQEGREQIKVIEDFQRVVPIEDQAKTYETFASRLKDPNLSNMEQYIKEMTEEIDGRTLRPELRDAGIKSPHPKILKPDKLLTAALNPWAIGIRRSLRMNESIKDFAAKNPEQVYRFATNKSTTDLALNPTPLLNLYKTFFKQELGKIIETLPPETRSARAWGPGPATKAIDDLAEKITKEHLDAMSKTRRADLAETISKVVSPAIREGTSYPDLRTINNSISGIYGEQLAPMFSTVRHGFKDLVIRMPEMLGLDDVGKAAWQKRVEDFYKREKIYLPEQGREITKSSAWDSVEKSLRNNVLGLSDRTSPYMSGLQYTFAGEAMQTWRSFMEANGATLGFKMFNDISENMGVLRHIAGSDLAFTYGSSFVKQMDSVLKMGATDAVKVEEIFAGKMTLWKLVENIIDAGRRVATSGMLGGWVPVLAGLRYLGQNLLTAPLIMSATLGKLGAMSVNPKNMLDLLRTYGGDANTVLFKDIYGVSYTAGEVRYLMGRHNRGMSQEMVHFSNQQAFTIMKESGLTATGKNAGPLKRAVDTFDPRDFNLYANMATKTDQFFRDLAFVKGVKEGIPAGQAANLAKVAMLDYGAIDLETRKHLNKYFMFFRFRIMMLTEVANNMARAVESGKPTLMTSHLKYNMRQQDKAEQWLYSDNQTKRRLYNGFKSFAINNTNINLLGPINPTVESFEVMSTTASLMMDTFLGGLSLAKSGEYLSNLIDYAANAQYRPAINMIKEALIDNDRPRHVPGEYVSLLKSMGAWNYAKDMFDIHIKQDYLRPEGVFFSEEHKPYLVQYEFTDKGALLWSGMTFAMTLAGIDRTIRDYGKAYLMYQGDTKEMRTGKYSQTPLWKYLLNLETPISAINMDQKSVDTLYKQINTWKKKTQKVKQRTTKQE